MAVRFELDGEPVVTADLDAHVTLLQWLRASGRTGTKEGCAEGECGACAVAVVARDAQGRPVFEPINSCLVPLANLGGRRVITCEGIGAPGRHVAGSAAASSTPGTGMHPVQRAMVEEGGSQCGYCTPGFVVSLFCEYYRPGRSAYDPEAISGNLCRCTGYRPIVAAARRLPLPSSDDPWLEVAGQSAPADVGGESPRFLRPASLRGALEALEALPDATLIAGGTDLMVAANLRARRWSTLVALDGVVELTRVESSSDELTWGAALPLSRLAEHLEGDRGLPFFAQLLPLFSSRLIRNRATLGGNLATASPIGDCAPVLLALDAELTLASASRTRRIALRDFFVGYRKTALERGELIAQIHVPRPLARLQRFYKVSKRVLDDISTVSAAFALDLDPTGRVERLRVAYGGVASTPLRAPGLETLAVGKPWAVHTLAVLLDELKSFGTPLSDHRGSADYRRAMIGKLLERFFAETQVTPGVAAADGGR